MTPVSARFPSRMRSGMLAALAAAVLIALVLVAPCAAGAARADDVHEATALGSVRRVTALLDADPKLVGQRNKFGWTPLHVAVARGYGDLAALLVKRGADLNAQETGRKSTPLHLAVEMGDVPVAKLLLEAGARADVKDATGRGPLHVCAGARGGEAVFKLLLAHKASVAAQDADGGTPLHWAAGSFQGAPAVTMLLEAGADPNAQSDAGLTPLGWALFQRVREPARLLREHGAQLNVFDAAVAGELDRLRALLKENPKLARAQSRDGHAPLHFAAHAGRIDAARALLDAGADVNASAEDVMTPLQTAALLRNLPMARLLRDADAKGDLFCAVGLGEDEAALKMLKEKPDLARARVPGGLTPLYPAAIWGNVDLVRALIAAGADVNAKQEDGTPVLYLLAGPSRAPGLVNRERRTQVARLLLAAGLKVNAAGPDGKTLLHLVMPFVTNQDMQMLLAAGADVDAPDARGRTPLHYAASSGNEHALLVMLIAMPDVDARDAMGFAPVHWLLDGAQIRTARLLVEHGAKEDVFVAAALGHTDTLSALLKEDPGVVSARLPYGGTALHVAAGGGEVRALRLLLDAGADLCAEDRYGVTPVLRAASAGEGAAVLMLREAGAKIETPSAKVARVAKPPQVDGVIAEGEYGEAEAVGDFVRMRGNGKPPQGTRFLIAYDEKAVYIGVIADEPEPKSIVSRRRQRDGDVWRDDDVEVFVDARHDWRTYHQFAVNFRGAQYDGIGGPKHGRYGDVEWNADWQVAAKVGEKECVVEFAIPHAALGVAPPKPGQKWGLNVCRQRFGGRRRSWAEQSAWSATYWSFHAPWVFGTIEFQ